MINISKTKRRILRGLEYYGYDCEISADKEAVICRKKNLRDVKVFVDSSKSYILIGNDKNEVKEGNDDNAIEVLNKIRSGRGETSLYDFFESD